MKKNLSSIFLIAMIAMWITSCSKDTPVDPQPDTLKGQEINTVSKFVYDGMSLFYKWADDMIDKKPTVNDIDQKKYFYSILHPTDTQHGWSWITDDVNGLIAGFKGESLSFGYVLGFTMVGNSPYAYIKYVYPNTPAAKAGMKRLDFIGNLNDAKITTVEKDGKVYISDRDYDLLFGNSTVKFTTYNYTANGLVKNKEVTITPDKTPKDPVLYTNIYNIGTKKIGYLFYTGFVDDFDNRLYEEFSKFKTAGITDLVLDLRYNHGGAVSSAIYLSSMIAPRNIVENKSPFIVMNYNTLLNNSFDQWYKEADEKDKYKYDRKDYLGTYVSANKNPLDVNLNLSKVYIIATGDSYSASELTTFCLKPYMNVVHIGSKTGGKYTASWTIHAYDKDKGNTVYKPEELSAAKKDELKNWAMQPIIAIYGNANNENFSATDGLIPDTENTVYEGNPLEWKPLGDLKDKLLGQAVYLITGDATYKPTATASTRSVNMMHIENNGDKPAPVRLNNVKLTPDDFKRLRELRNK